MINPSQRPLPDNTQHSQQTNIHASGGIRTHNLSRRAAVDLRPTPRGHWDRPSSGFTLSKSKLGLFKGRQKRGLKCLPRPVFLFLITNSSRAPEWISMGTFFALVYSPKCAAERWTIFIEFKTEMEFFSPRFIHRSSVEPSFTQYGYKGLSTGSTFSGI